MCLHVDEEDTLKALRMWIYLCVCGYTVIATFEKSTVIFTIFSTGLVFNYTKLFSHMVFSLWILVKARYINV